MAEYSSARVVEDKTVFSWWVSHTLRKHYFIVDALSLKVQKCSHKYGIELPISVAEARLVYQTNGNTFWVDAI